MRTTGDGFFVTFDDPASAIACAVAIQQALAEHRREQGFSPTVRIGLHRAEATKEGTDWSGKGVHAAARIGALAAGRGDPGQLGDRQGGRRDRSPSRILGP